MIIATANKRFQKNYYTQITCRSIDSELLSPSGFREDLLEAGLVGVDITIEEFSLADSWENIYPKLSIQDRIALAIAKQRNIVLLPGDMALRKAATKEGVSIMGTLGVLGRLYLYEKVRNEKIAPDFSLDSRCSKAELYDANATWLKCLQSPSIWMFYAPIIIIGVIIVSLKFAGVI